MDDSREPLCALLAGSSEARERLVEGLVRVARTPRTTVLVRGERGAGKRTAAERLHALSARRAGPCLVLRAGPALAPAALAAAARGAQGGTLVLLSVDRLAPDSQEALLSELVEPCADVRVVVTASHDLEADVEAGRLREELFYRLNVLSLAVPPLRERRADLPAIAGALLDELGRADGARAALAADALSALRAHPFPGNLRELRAVLEAAVARTGGEPIGAVDLALPDGRRGTPRADTEPDLSLRAAEERQIRRVLLLTGGNRSRAARALGINRQTLYNKLAELGLGPKSGVP